MTHKRIVFKLADTRVTHRVRRHSNGPAVGVSPAYREGILKNHEDQKRSRES